MLLFSSPSSAVEPGKWVAGRWGIGRALSRRVRVQMVPTAAVPRDDDGAERR